MYQKEMNFPFDRVIPKRIKLKCFLFKQENNKT
jgi:hypothetical protein